jgi:hypothetical protein
VVIRNKGNLLLSGLDLKLYVNVDNANVDSLFKSFPLNDILPGDSLVYKFSDHYSIPWKIYYLLEAKVYLSCSPELVNATTAIVECVEGMDLAMSSIMNPSGSQQDVAGSQVNMKVSLKNRSFILDYQDVKITALLSDSKGNITDSLQESVPFIQFASDTTYIFTAPYTVPNDANYSIAVFITNPVDNYPENDTLYAVRTTDYVIGIAETNASRISMSQNIPNPSNGTTRIDYSLPTDGEVSLHVYTISGQELFNQVVETTSGKHSIDLNTTSLASGIYFYSMEFKGQRIVKRMSVNN